MPAASPALDTASDTAEAQAALAFHNAVTEAVRDVAGQAADELLDSVRFLEALDPITDLELDDPEFERAIREAALQITEAGDPSKPYGDVQYADPGYQEDGKHRYPLDSEEHCRAAWSYVNQQDNASKYSAKDLAKVKAKIKAALKKYGVDVTEAEDGGEAEGTRVTEGVEEEDHIEGRLLEARGTNDAGGRVFAVQIIRAGESRNGRRYPAKVLREAVHLYNGAKAYDHHRSQEELRSSTINGLVGHYRNVQARDDGLYGELHLLPSATHSAEALDASLAAQAQGLPPLVGISHDALTVLRPVQEGRRRVQEAVQITRVHSADVVADPAAGGKATRVLAGGVETDPADAGQSNEEEDVAITSEAVLEALQTATPEQLAAVGLSRTSEATEPEEPDLEKDSFLGKLMIQQKVSEAKLPPALATHLAEALPVRITEADVDWQISALKGLMGVQERAGLVPTVTVQVTKEAHDKKVERLDAFFAADYGKGYHSIKQAYVDFTGYRDDFLGEDLNRKVLHESFGVGYDSGLSRTLESGSSSTWSKVLGDSVTRRMVDEYNSPAFQDWRKIVSSIVPTADFRTQRVSRIGGYGTLPTVNEGAPYQPLTTPSDEEATYALAKKGGTEDVTLEMIANDDRGAIQKIPTKLGKSAAITLYRFIFDLLPNNATCTYDSTALFHANHSNTDNPAVLTQTTLSTGRKKMIQQAAFGNSVEVLGLMPRYLVVPPDLEELGFQLTTSAVAVPSTPAGPSDTPNIHQANGLQLLMVPYYTDTNDWYLVADPATVPTIEVGFYQGRDTPELFTQNDPNVGSVFSSDKFTWKIRFIFSGTILDHRGFYRGNN